jgi:hypothetical protein
VNLDDCAENQPSDFRDRRLSGAIGLRLGCCNPPRRKGGCIFSKDRK